MRKTCVGFSLVLLLLLCGACAVRTSLTVAGGEEYRLAELYSYRTRRMGDASLLDRLARLLPAPNPCLAFAELRIESPETLTLEYRLNGVEEAEARAALEANRAELSGTLQRNALVLFSLVGELREVGVSICYAPLGGEAGLGLAVENRIVPRDTFARYGELSKLWSGDWSGIETVLREVDEESAYYRAMLLADVRTLAEKGAALAWEDFRAFIGEAEDADTTRYDIETDYVLRVRHAGGVLESARFAKRFMDTESEGAYVELREGDLEGYLAEDTARRFVLEKLDVIASSPAVSSNPGDYMAAHRAECEAIRGLQHRAFPTLIEILNEDDRSVRGLIAQALTEETLGLRMLSSQGTPEVEEWDARAKEALERYTGRPYTVRLPGG